jgi:hypothetical protein
MNLIIISLFYRCFGIFFDMFFGMFFGIFFDMFFGMFFGMVPTLHFQSILEYTHAIEL